MPLIDLTKNKKNNSNGGSFNGSKDMGDLKNWRILSGDSNDILKGEYGLLSERSSTLYHTYGPCKSAVNKNVTYGVGPGLVFRSQPDFKRLGMSIESAKSFAKDLQKIVDSYMKRFNLYEKQSILYRSALYGGDSFLWFERKNGFISDIFESLNNQVAWNFNDDDFTLGIKHDKQLRKQAVKKTDGTTVDFQNSLGDQNVIQCYFKELGRQLRGFPLVYSVINLSRSDDTFTDAIVDRAVMESILIGHSNTDSTDIGQQLKNLANTNRSRKGKWFDPIRKLAGAANLGSGNLLELSTGEGFTFHDMKTPSDNYDVFKKWIIYYIAMATDTPPEVIMSLYSTSFTAHKGALNDFIKAYMKKRATFERTVMDVLVREIVKDAIMLGYIKAPGFLTGDWLIQQAYLSGVYLGPIPGHINPLVEVKAKKEQVKAGFEKTSTFALENGNDWDIHYDQWLEEQQQWAAAPDDFKAWTIWKAEQEKVGV